MFPHQILFPSTEWASTFSSMVHVDETTDLPKVPFIILQFCNQFLLLLTPTPRKNLALKRGKAKATTDGVNSAR